MSDEVWLERREVQELLGITQQAIQKAIKSGKLKVKEAYGNGGRRYLIALSSLPTEARLKYLTEKGLAVKQEREVEAPPAVPDRYREIALARLDLVRLWRNYRDEAEQKREADEAFLKAYNSGLMAPKIYEILGEVSLKTLYRWVDALDGTEDYTRLIPGWRPAIRGCRLTMDERDVFFRFLLDPKGIKVGEAVRLTKFYLEQKGIPSPSHPITFRRFAEKWKAENLAVWTLMREGQKALRDKLEPFIRRDPSLLQVGDVLVADGHRLAFQVINPFTGKPCRPVLVAFLDWKSFALVGYEVMLTENTQCIASALRNAIINLGKIPKIIYIDNGKAFRAKYFTGVSDFNETGLYGLFARLGIVPQFALPYNARAKVIERWFLEFQETFEKLIPSYVGSSVAKRPAYLLRNEKFHKQIHREYIPTLEETIALIQAWLHFDLSQPCPHVSGKTKAEVLEAQRGQGVDIDALDDLMMCERITTITRNGIRFLGAEYYHEALYGLRQQVIVRYSLFDLRRVKVYDLMGNLVCVAERRVPVHPAARVLGTVKDMEELKRQLSEQRRLERKTIQAAKELIRRDTKVELDWQKVAEVAPRVVDRLEDEDIQIPAIEEHIPEETVRAVNDEGESGNNGNGHESQERPFFGMDEIARYEWHLKHGFQTEEDWQFKEYFESSLAYKMLKQFLEEEQKEVLKGGF